MLVPLHPKQLNAVNFFYIFLNIMPYDEYLCCNIFDLFTSLFYSPDIKLLQSKDNNHLSKV